MTNFVKQKTEEGKYVHFHCDSKKLRNSCYMVSFGKFYPHFILDDNSKKELAFRYSMISYEKYYTKT